MILYVNGDSHTAAAEAVNTHAFACDDGQLWQLGRRPHPDNERVSWGYQLAGLLDSSLINQSESASSNDRIMRTAVRWINQNQRFWDRLMVVIQWSTWERQEWIIDGEHYQINASGIDQVPESHQDLYRQYIIDIDWKRCTHYWHDQIWQFHQTLQQHRIAHVFFNGNTDFSCISDRKDWNSNYINPYQKQGTFDSILRDHGYPTVNPQSWHFGADAHCFWAEYMLQYLHDHEILESL